MHASIRLATEHDAEAIAAIYAPFCNSTAVSFEDTPPSPVEIAQRIARITQRLPWLVLKDDGDVAGYAYASPHRERAAYRWSVDVTVYVHPRYQRRGVGSALYTALFAILAQQGYFQAFAGVALPNPGSEGLHEAMGFEVVGVYRSVGWKLGVWHDVRWYRRGLQAQDGEPTATLPTEAVADTPGWKAALAAGLALYRRTLVGGEP